MALIKSAKTKKFPVGQSLIETIAAIAILLTVATAILSLVINNIIGQKESEFQIIANNLAREGIEVARNKRDSNSLAGVNWDAGLAGQSQRAIASFNASANEWELIFGDAGGQEKIYLSTNVGYKGIYSHDSDRGQPLPFSRYLIFSNICLDDVGNELIKDDFCDPGKNEKKIGFKVRAVVSWIENKRTREVALEELLYAWK